MRRMFKAAFAGLVGLGLMAAAPAPGFTPPKWLHRPRAEDLMSVWPREALDRGSGGKATIHCKVSTAGALFDCKVVSEFPQGDGFGGAAMALANQFQLTPALQDGTPVVFDGVTLPIEFAKPAAPTASHLAGKSSLRGETKPLLTNPPWRAVPTVAEMAAAYPPKAAAAREGGRALVRCNFDPQGRTTACDTLFEEPKASGFGLAARSLAKSFVGPATFGDDRPIREAATQIPFIFTPELLDPSLASPHPNWVALPGPADLASAFPAKARAAGVRSAKVVLGCMANAAGGLEACEIQSEDPPGHGFGAATLNLVPAFKLKTWTDDGRPMVGGRVRLPLRYEDDQAPLKP